MVTEFSCSKIYFNSKLLYRNSLLIGAFDKTIFKEEEVISSMLEILK